MASATFPPVQLVRALAGAVKSTNDSESAEVLLVIDTFAGRVVSRSPDGKSVVEGEFEVDFPDTSEMLTGSWRISAAELRNAIRSGEGMVERHPITIQEESDREGVRLTFKRTSKREPAQVAVVPEAGLPPVPARQKGLPVYGEPVQWLNLAHFATEAGTVQVDFEERRAYALRPDGGTMVVTLASMSQKVPPLAPSTGVAGSRVEMPASLVREVGVALQSVWKEEKSAIVARNKMHNRTAAKKKGPTAREQEISDAMPFAEIAIGQGGGANQVRAGVLQLSFTSPDLSADEQQRLVDIRQLAPRKPRKSGVGVIMAKETRAALQWAMEAERTFIPSRGVRPPSLVSISFGGEGEVRLRINRPTLANELSERMRDIPMRAQGRVPFGIAEASALFEAVDMAAERKRYEVEGLSDRRLAVSQFGPRGLDLMVVLPPARQRPSQTQTQMIELSREEMLARDLEVLRSSGEEEELAELYADEQERGSSRPVRASTEYRLDRAYDSESDERLEDHIRQMKRGGWMGRKLSPAEREALVVRAQGGDEAAKEELVKSLTAHALKLSNKPHHRIPKEDRFALAQAAILEAIERWTPDKKGILGYSELLFAGVVADEMPRISGAQVTYSEYKSLAKVLQAVERLKERDISHPSPREIAVEMGLPVAGRNPSERELQDEDKSILRVERVLAVVRSRRATSLSDRQVSREEEWGGRTPRVEDVIPQAPYRPERESRAQPERDARVEEMVQALPFNEAHAMASGYGVGGRFQLVTAEYEVYRGVSRGTVETRLERGKGMLKEAVGSVLSRSQGRG